VTWESNIVGVSDHSIVRHNPLSPNPNTVYREYDPQPRGGGGAAGGAAAAGGLLLHPLVLVLAILGLVIFLVYVLVQRIIKPLVRWIFKLEPPAKPVPAAKTPRAFTPAPAPKYQAHALDGSIIGTFDTVLDAEVCGLTAAGVSPADLPLVLHERRRLGTYGSLLEPEPARADQPNQPAGPAGPIGGPSPTWGERIRETPDMRKAYPPKRLSDCRDPYQ
jgi:hypothetical protein